MPATVSELGARVRRKLGLGIIPQSSITTDTTTFTLLDVAQQALREMGIPVQQPSRPAASPAVGLDDLASRTQRAVGLSPIASTDAHLVNSYVDVSTIAVQALALCGVNPLGAGAAAAIGTVTSAAIATQALAKLGVFASDETPDATNLAFVVGIFSEVFNDATQSGLIAWGIESNPTYAQGALVQMTMARAGSAYGRPQTQAEYDAGFLQLWRLALSGPPGRARAEQAVFGVHDRMAQLGYADWPSTLVPDRAQAPYAALAAADLLPQFMALRPGMAEDASARAAAVAPIQAAAQAAMETLRRMALSGAYGHQLAAAKVAAAHDAMAALGYVSWPLTAVPAAHAEDYVALAVVTLGPQVGRDPAQREADAAAATAAQGRLKRAAQVAAAQDLAGGRVVEVLTELKAANLADWDADEVPATYFTSLVQLVRVSLAPSFDEKYDPVAYELTMKRIRAIAMAGPAGQALAEQKVRAVHANLDARGKVRWSLFDVPDYAEEPYVFMAASLLAPECDHPPVPQWWQEGETMLARLTVLPSRGRPVRAVYF